MKKFLMMAVLLFSSYSFAGTKYSCVIKEWDRSKVVQRTHVVEVGHNLVLKTDVVGPYSVQIFIYSNKVMAKVSRPSIVDGSEYILGKTIVSLGEQVALTTSDVSLNCDFVQ